MDIGSKSFIVLLFYLHQVGSMDICVAEFRSKDGFDFFAALYCLGGLTDEHVGEAMLFGLNQVCAALSYDVSGGFYVHEPVL